MHKVFITIFITLLNTAVIAQSFDLQVNGYKPVVFNVDSVLAEELYQRVVSWVDSTQKTSTFIDSSNIDEKRIIVSGYAVRKMKYSMHNYDFKYQMFVKFKDGKYQVNFEVGDMYTPNGDKSYSDYHSFFKKNGSVKYYSESAKISLDIYFNTLADELFTWMKLEPETFLEEKVEEIEEIW
jgi:hypothetical protein